MKPPDFIQKWQTSELNESAAAQEHFLDLCHLLGEATPAGADPQGAWFRFERLTQKTTGKRGFADVWRKDCFGWI